MRRILLLAIFTAAALVAAVVIFIVGGLPPRALLLESSSDSSLVWGAYHVHSTRSDGSGTVEEIARAAARTGLNFVVLTDHGDATSWREPEYLHGVLCIHATEINSEAGHIVALGLRGSSPYPLAGDARDVVEDIKRQGGVAIIAHPESPRETLRWRGQGTVDVDGIEWLNIDAEWRSQTTRALVAAGLRSLVRAPESVGALLHSAPESIARLDRPSERRPRFSMAALDAHARIGADDQQSPRLSLKFPGYETLFRTVAETVRLAALLSGDAARDSAALVDAIAAGHSYSVVRAFGDANTEVALDVIDDAAGVVVRGRVSAPNARLVLLRDGQEVASGTGEVTFSAPAEHSRFRLLAFLAGWRFPWIVTNPVDVLKPHGGEVAAPAPSPAPLAPGNASAVVPVTSWQIEKDGSSTATLEARGEAAVLRFQLGSGRPAGQYVALAASAGAEPIEGMVLQLSSAQPMRVSVQVRVPGGADGRRWRRSFYLDSGTRDI
jgi:hypothetical protein